MAKESKRILVTGGAGFIGSNLVKRLLELEHFVRVIDNFSTGREANIREFLSHKNFEFIKGDLTNLETCQKAVKDIEYLLHVAAIPSVPRSVKDPFATNQANVLGTLNLLIAARDEGRIKKFVYSSSSSIYGDLPKLPKKEIDPVNPISPYALSKYTGERYCQIFSRIYELPTVCLRYFNVFGPKQNPISQYAAVIPRFIFYILKGKQPIIYGDGQQSRDFTFIDNVVEANILAAFSDLSDEVINIACGERTSVNELVKLVNQLLEINIKPLYEEARLGEVRHSLADISKAKRLLDYKPKIHLKEGLKKTIDWFKKSDIFEITERFVSIRLANEEDIEKISQIYKEKVRTGFISSLGVPFLTKLYEAIIKSDDAICIVAETDEGVVGFVAGTFNINKFYWYFSKKQFLKALIPIFLKILHPKRFRKVFETLFYPQKKKGLSKAELFFIEADEHFEDQGLKELLFKNFVVEMRKRNINSFKATVSETFKSTIDFYKKMGFEFYEPIELHKGHQSEIYIYRLE